ncbi:MAG: phosphatase PAP2 family protein [Paludibacteraceae bacterium]
MEIIHYLDSIDKQLLLALNNDYALFWDNLMLLITAKLVWIPFYASILYVVIKNWKKESWLIVLGLILCIVIADQTASGFLKNMVQRYRPSKDPSLDDLVVIVNGVRGGGLYGFVSSHAANTFSLALLTSLLFRNKVYIIVAFIWTVVVSYSRIYLAVHYPGDILGGMLVGAGAALLIYWLLKKLRPQLFEKQSHPVCSQVLIPVFVLALSFLLMIVYSAVA